MNFRSFTRTQVAGGAVVVAAIIAAVVAYAVVSSGGGSSRPASLPGDAASLGLDLRALDSDSLGVGADSAFSLKSAVDLTIEEVKAALRVSPAADFQVKEKSRREFQLEPRQPLTPDTVFKFSFVSGETDAVAGSWAFQVRSPLRVVSTLPASERAQIPVDTGIEITFSSDGVVSPQDFVEISPKPEGHFEQHKRTLVFVPRELDENTLYTVRVKKGVAVQGSDRVLDEDYVFQFETGQARRGAPTPTFAFSRKAAEFTTQEPPLVAVSTSDQALRQLSVSVYAYRSIDDFLADLDAFDQLPAWTVYSRERQTVSTARLDAVSTFSAQIEGFQDPKAQLFGPPQLFFRFPEALPAGFYLLQTTYAGKPVQAWLQITDLATYVAVSETKTLVWINDLATAGPLPGAKVAGVKGNQLGTTDAEGVAQFDTPGESMTAVTASFFTPARTTRGHLMVTDDKGRRAVVPLSPILASSASFNSPYQFVSPGDDYWRFLATDRPLYQPDDKVRFWGVARPRDGKPLTELTVELLSSSGPAGERLGAPILVSVSDLSTFEGEMPLHGLAVGYYTLQAKNNGEAVTSAFVQVSRYIKPAYRIEAKPSKQALVAGESFDIDVEVSFFDGTPVAGLDLRYSTPKGPTGQTLTTDANGRARVHLAAELNPGLVGLFGYYFWESQTFSFAPVRAEEGEITGDAQIVVFPATVALRTTASIANGQVTVSGDAYDVDLARFEQGLVKGLFLYYGGSPNERDRPAYLTNLKPGQAITVSITEITYDQREIGERYDFINKISHKVYSYTDRRTPLPPVTISTDPQGRFSYSFPAKDGASYQINLTTRDAAGRSVTFQASAGTGGFTFGTLSFTYLRTDQNPSVFFSSGVYGLGDKAGVTMYRGDDALPSGGKNRYLYYEAQRGIRRYTVQDGSAFSLTFSEQQVPSVSVGGVYFNGFTYIEPFAATTLRFSPESRKLNIDLSTPQQSYGPGAEATVDVRVTDAASKPVQAEVNLSAIDEALFAVSDFSQYQTDILSAVYTPVRSGIIRTYASHQYPLDQGGAGGRGGDGNARQNFPDIAFFGSVRTDKDGRAQVKFRLPDNLTSWRVTAYGVTSELLAGKGLGEVVVSQPFFVDVALNVDYLTADKPVLRARGFGAALKAGDTVQVSLTAPSLGLTTPLTASGPAFQAIDLALPALAAGEHDIKIEATSGAMKDAVVRHVRVVASRLVTPQARYYDSVTASTTLEGAADGRTDVVLMDGGRGRFYTVLQRLRWSYGDRIDQALARTLASQLLSQYFGEPPSGEAFVPDVYLTRQLPKAPIQGPIHLNPYQGIALLPYADPDLTLTARMAALAPDLFGRNLLRAYLNYIVSDKNETPERVAIAFYGLASLGDPVLLQLQGWAGDPDLGWRGRLFLALAFQASGDDATARAQLDALVKDFGEDLQTYRRLRVGSDQDDIVEATSLAAILSAGLGDGRADAFFRYVVDNRTTDILISLEELSYAKAGLARSGAGRLRFAYTVDGKREEVTLEKGAARRLSLLPAQLKELRVEPIEGRLAASTVYLAPLSPSLKPSPDLTVTRTYRSSRPAGAAPVPPPTTAFPETGLIEVVLDFTIGPQAPDGCYQLTDILPSGLKPVTKPSFLTLPPGGPFAPARVTFPYYVDGQRVSFCVSKSSPRQIVYYARPSGRGEFVTEPALISNQRAPAAVSLSSPGRVEIR